MAKVHAGSTPKRTTPSLLGKSIKARRLACRWSQSELARRSNIDPTAICRLESGQRRTISYRTAIDLSTVFNCRIDDLHKMPE